MRYLRVGASSVAILASIVLFQNCGKGFASRISEQVVQESTSSSVATPPVFQAATFIGPPSPVTSSTAFGFDFRANPTATGTPVKTDCQVDTLPGFSCSSPELVRSLPEGDHIFTVFVTYTDGLVLQSSYKWTIDRTGPLVTTSNAPAAMNSLTSLQLNFTVFDSNKVTATQCSLDNAAFVNCTSPLSLNNLVPGPHQLVIRATDVAGNNGFLNLNWTTQ